MRAVTWLWTILVLGLSAGCSDDGGSGDGGGGSGDGDGGSGSGDGGSGGGSGDGGSGDGGSAGGGSDSERGRYLVEHVALCSDCHTPRNPDGSFDESRALAGVQCFFDVDRADDTVGCLHTRNLTDHATGLANRSDQEIKDMFLRGERPDGSALHPVMPYYVLGNMSDTDADAIVAYLRTVTGVDHMVPDSQAPFDNVTAPAPRWPEAAIPMPRNSYSNQEAARRGRYLAGNIGICMECHTERDDQMLPVVDKAFQGGNVFGRGDLGLPEVFPEMIVSPNITPHATGIADLEVADIVAVLEEGLDPTDMTPLCPPMPAGPMRAFGGLADRDAQDIAHYLLSIPGGDNEIASDCVPPAPPDDDAIDD